MFCIAVNSSSPSMCHSMKAASGACHCHLDADQSTGARPGCQIFGCQPGGTGDSVHSSFRVTTKEACYVMAICTNPYLVHTVLKLRAQQSACARGVPPASCRRPAPAHVWENRSTSSDGAAFYVDVLRTAIKAQNEWMGFTGLCQYTSAFSQTW